MRRAVKEQILQLLQTLQEAHKEIAVCLQKGDVEQAKGILAECQDCAVLIGNTVEQSESDAVGIVPKLENYCELLFRVHTELTKEEYHGMKQLQDELNTQLLQITKAVKNEIKAPLKMVFMPYKASMWTSLATIWEAAQKDPDCEATVVVLPYYNLDIEQKPTELVYEAELFPTDIPIVPYMQYDFAKEHPDMIYIHNPYDGGNNVTRLPEQYYSYNLKKHTDKLVFSPYGLMGYYNPDIGAMMCCTSAVSIADKIIVQSEKVKQIYMDYGVEENRLLALGSPKVDAVVKSLDEPIVYPEGWKERLEGRKVFLLNTHLSYFIKGYLYKKKFPERMDYTAWYHRTFLDMLLNREGCALIWRPHPLLKATLKSRNLNETLALVEECEQRIYESDNAVIDKNGSYDMAFRISDALISTYSSMIPEYMLSGKPVYIYENRLNEENRKNSPVDYTNNYYKARVGEEPQFSIYIDMILRGEDPLYEKRMEDIKRAFVNREGTIGQNIYNYLKTELLDEYRQM